MSHAATADTISNARAEKRSVAMVSVLAASVMTLLKLITGLLTGSLGMLSDAAHSGIDLAGAGLTFLSVRVSDKPADENHPYGHGHTSETRPPTNRLAQSRPVRPSRQNELAQACPGLPGSITIPLIAPQCEPSPLSRENAIVSQCTRQVSFSRPAFATLRSQRQS